MVGESVNLYLDLVDRATRSVRSKKIAQELRQALQED